MTFAWLLIAVPIFVLGLAVVNLLIWPRGDRRQTDEKVSALVPARNEARNIEMCVRALAAQNEIDEIVVYEDRSSDDTRAILDELRSEFGHLKIVDGIELPDGWVGKPHACFQLAQHATQPWLFFIDADVKLSDGGIARMLDIAKRYGANAVTAVPQQRYGSFFERLIVPLLHLTYVAWLPLFLIWRTHDPRFLAANGQLLLVKRDSYDRCGGFESVKDAVVDDMAFCTQLKQLKERVVFADGYEIATCRMYASTNEVWKGFSKNIFEGIGSIFGLVVVVCLYTGTFVLPYIALGASFLLPELFVPAAVAVLANVAIRTLLAVRFSQPVEGIVLHPFAILGLIAIAINSAKWHFSDEIEWAGRVYPKRGKR